MENKARTNLRILNYEVGVLFVPQNLVSFSLSESEEELHTSTLYQLLPKMCLLLFGPVLFCCQQLLTSYGVFPFQISKSRLPLTNQSPAEDGPLFPMPYDIPLTNYNTKEDVPWFIDMLQSM
jgi:hypothetical protein